jgi:hypothetical protein
MAKRKAIRRVSLGRGPSRQPQEPPFSSPYTFLYITPALFNDLRDFCGMWPQ